VPVALQGPAKGLEPYLVMFGEKCRRPSATRCEWLMAEMALRDWTGSGGLTLTDLAGLVVRTSETRPSILQPLLNRLGLTVEHLGPELCRRLSTYTAAELGSFLKAASAYDPERVEFFNATLLPHVLDVFAARPDHLEAILEFITARYVATLRNYAELYYVMLQTSRPDGAELRADALRLAGTMLAKCLQPTEGRWPERPRPRSFNLRETGILITKKREACATRGDLDYMLPLAVMDFVREGAGISDDRKSHCLYYVLMFEELPGLPQESLDYERILTRFFQDYMALANGARGGYYRINAVLDAIKLAAMVPAFARLPPPEALAEECTLTELFHFRRDSCATTMATILELVKSVLPVDQAPLPEGCLALWLWHAFADNVADHLRRAATAEVVLPLLEQLDARAAASDKEAMPALAWAYASRLVEPLLLSVVEAVDLRRPPGLLNVVTGLAACQPEPPPSVRRLSERLADFLNKLVTRPQRLRDLRDLLQPPSREALEAWCQVFDTAFPAGELEARVARGEEALRELARCVEVLDWLERRGVREVMQESDAARGVLDRADAATPHELQQACAGARRLLSDPLPRGRARMALEMTTFEFLAYFTGNVTFEALVRRCRQQGDGDLTLRDVRTICGEALDMFHGLFFERTPNLADLQCAQDLLRHVDVAREVEHAAEFFRDCGRPVADKRLRAIERALRHLQYLGYLPELLHLIEQYRLVSPHDPDLEFLQEFEEAGREDADLGEFDEADESYARLAQLLRHLNPAIMDLFRLVRDHGNLRAFLCEDQFAPHRHAELEARNANITMVLQGQDFKNGIFNAFLAARTYLRPFLYEGQALTAFLDNVHALRLREGQELQCVASAGAQLGLIRELYTEAGQTSVQNTVNLIKRLLDPASHAAMRVHLRRQLNAASAIELTWREGERDGAAAEGRTERLGEDQLDELERCLNFTRDDPKHKNEVGRFLERLRLLRALATSLVELEGSGHPLHQLRSEEQPLAGTALEVLRARSATFEEHKRVWLDMVEALPPAATALSNVELCRLLNLVRFWVDADQRREFLEACACRPIAAGEDLDAVSHTLAKALLTPVEQACGLAAGALAGANFQDFRRNRCRIVGAGEALSQDFWELDDDAGAAILHMMFVLPPQMAGAAPGMGRAGVEGRQYFATFGDAGLQAVPAFILQRCLSHGTGCPPRLPCAADVLWCSGATTTHDLDFFYRRVRAFSQRTFFVVGLDGLPMERRKQVYRLQSELHAATTATADVVYCIVDETQVCGCNAQIFCIPHQAACCATFAAIDSRQHATSGP
jgi:hypothetical protein